MAKDLYHEAVKLALEKDGWTITHDPFKIRDKAQNLNYEVDLGAEKLLAAEKGTEKIAIEIKSCLKSSLANEFHTIVGQYITYIDAIEFLNIDRELILAIPLFAQNRLKQYPFLLHLIDKHQIKMLVYDEIEQEIISWKR